MFKVVEIYFSFYKHFFLRRDIEDAESLAPTVDFEMPPKQPGMQRESTVTFDPDTGKGTIYKPSCCIFLLSATPIVNACVNLKNISEIFCFRQKKPCLRVALRKFILVQYYMNRQWFSYLHLRPVKGNPVFWNVLWDSHKIWKLSKAPVDQFEVYMGISLCFSISFTMGNQFCDFLLASVDKEMERKEFTHTRENSLL